MQALLVILECIALSLTATDCLQTQDWAAGTSDDPIVLSHGIAIYETNPIIAGHPEKCEEYFAFREGVIEALPKMLSPPLAACALGYIVATGAHTVSRNDAILAQQGCTRYLMIKWRWHF